ncbi:phage tail tape measure C-terminal domain-containing protein [Xanthobacter sp. DSM 14520]|uniref:phage tail tape measure C-terminal domain-containing protein n=1 Tax=Xanthobacter autotrophicus (strain ATCC BAA-1158 / Py2) TaxID=78245 RepID=UPI00372C9842
MAEKQVGVRLSVIDGGKVKAELRSVGQEGAASLDKIRQATEPASAGLKVVNAAAQDINGRMAGMAGNAGVAASALSALGPVGAIAAAAVGAVALAVGKGLTDFAEAEKVTQRLTAVLEATGYSAGLTADQLDEFADRMEASTMATAEGVKGAAAVLATFRSISGDTFTRTIGLAQDMAATFGGDLSSAALQLGKALEDPINGVSALQRVGVTFSAVQKDVIKNLVETGQKAEAQKLILDVLAKQVGGAGNKEADSVAGAFKRAGDAVGNFLEELVQITGIAPGTRDALEGIAAGVNKVTVNLMGAGSIGARIGVATKELADAQTQLQEARDLANNTGLAEDQQAVSAWEKRVEELKSKIDSIRTDARAADAKAGEAADGQAKAQADQATEAVLAKQAEYNKALEGLATLDEKLAALRSTLSKDIAALNSLKENGADPEKIDKAIATANEVARRSEAELRKPAEDAAKKASEQTRSLIDDLTASINTFGDKRADFIRKYVDRVGEGASDAEIARVRELAGALFDGQKAAEAHTKAIGDGKHVTEEVQTATEKYTTRLAELDKYLKDGAISQETYARAVAKAKREMEDASTDGLSGLRRGLRQYSDEANNAAKAMEGAISGAFKGMEDALVDLVSTGKVDFKSLVDSMIADLARLAIRQAITGPLASALGGLLGGAPALTGSGFTTGIYHSGGRVGASTPETRQVPAALWSMAPRAHSGARLLGPGEVPIIAELGERVLNRKQTRDYEAALSGQQPAGNVSVSTPPTQVVFNGAPAGTRVEQRDDGNGGRRLDVFFDEQVAASMRKRGSRTQQALGGYSVRPSLVRR